MHLPSVLGIVGLAKQKTSAPLKDKTMPLSLESLHRPPYPSQMIIDVHSYCNAKCIICPYDSLKKKLPMGVMQEELFCKIIADFAALGRSHGFRGHVLFCNMGEFFLYPEISIERMKYVLAAGLDFDIQTNGSLMLPKLVDRVLAAGFKGTFMISCHGVSSGVHEAIMGVDRERSLANIDYLLEHYPREHVCIQSIPYRWPFGETRRVRRYWRERNVKVRMPLPNDRAGLVGRLAAGQDHATLVGCAANRPLGEMIVSFNGDVPLCCNDMAQKEIVGNLGSSTIEEVWNGEKMLQKLRQIYFGAPTPASFICRKCEFGLFSTSQWQRLLRNIRHESRKFYLTLVR